MDGAPSTAPSTATELRKRCWAACQRYLPIFAIYGVWKIVLLRTMVVAGLATDSTQNEWNRYLLHDSHFWAAPFANWDGQHYLLLIRDGYGSGRSDSVAFYPLFPLLTRLLAWVIRDIYVAAFAVTTLFGFLFACLFHTTLRRLDVDEERSLCALVLMLSYPAAFFMTAFYSESVALFVFLGFFYFYAVRRDNWSLLFALLLPWAKGQGMFLGVVIALDLAVNLVRRRPLEVRFALLNLLAVGVGGAAVLGFYWLTTGNPLAQVDAQKHFVFNVAIANILSPTHFLRSFYSASRELFAYNNSIADKIFVGFTFLCFWPVVFAKDWKVSVAYLVLVLPTAMMGDGGSYIRHSLLVWPFIVLSMARQKLLSRMATCVFATLLLMIQMYLATRFAENLWVG